MMIRRAARRGEKARAAVAEKARARAATGKEKMIRQRRSALPTAGEAARRWAQRPRLARNGRKCVYEKIAARDNT